MHIPALLKILLLFAAIVGLYRAKVPLWIALPGVSGAAGLWFGRPAEETARLLLKSAVSGETLFLCAVVVLLMGFSNLLNKTGVLERLVGAYCALLGKSMYSGAALPALIGLLPMPGGAIFSAPMVEAACARSGGQSPEDMAAINYWFRHVWEYWWPMYPGVILASQIFRVSAWKLAALHLPLTTAAVVAGYFFILRPSFAREEKQPENGGNGRGLLREALSQSASILIVIAMIFCVGPVFAALGIGGLSAKYWPVIMGVTLGMGWLAVSSRAGVRKTAECIFTREQLFMVLLAVGVMEFRDMLVAADAFTAAQGDLVTYHVPAVAVICALPFVAGFVMGLSVGYVGASFPLVISLLPAAVVKSDARFAYMALAYSFGYMGMMVSPVHLCLLVTKDYFKADFVGIYRKLLPSAGTMLAAGFLLFFLYRLIFKQ